MHNNGPKNDVLEHWKISFPIRKIDRLTPHEFFEQWPTLKTQVAIDLVRYCSFIVNMMVLWG